MEKSYHNESGATWFPPNAVRLTVICCICGIISFVLIVLIVLAQLRLSRAIERAKIAPSLPQSRVITALEWSSNDEFVLAASTSGFLGQCGPSPGIDVTRRLPKNNYVTDLACDVKHNRFSAVTLQGDILEIAPDLNDRSVRSIERRRQVIAVENRPDGSLVMLFGDGTLEVWDRASGECESSTKSTEATVSRGAIGRSRLLTFVDSDEITVHALNAPRNIIARHRVEGVANLVLSPDEESVFLLVRSHELVCWNTQADSIAWNSEVPLTDTEALTIDSSGTVLALGGFYGEATLIDAGNGRVKKRLRYERRPIASLSFAESGNFLAAGGFDNDVWIWEVATGKVVASRRLDGTDNEKN